MRPRLRLFEQVGFEEFDVAKILIRTLWRVGLAAFAMCLVVQSNIVAAASVVAEHGMVVSAQHLASDVGLKVLKAGGNAVDAAVAVGYALAVVYPAAGNLGGGGFMTIRFADGRTTFLDFREKAPLAATRTLFQDDQGRVVPGLSTDSWLAVGVPGTIAGLEAARSRYGHLSRHDVIAPAIALAQNGFALDQGDASMFASETLGLAADPGARAIFTRDGQALQAGDILIQPQLAHSLSIIDALGTDSIMGGPLAQAVVDASTAGHGLISMQDFARYRVRELPPVSCTYRGYAIISAPPPSSGGVIICEALNILEGYDLHAMGFHTVAETHVLVEAMRRAYRDRNTKLGDPDFVENPVAHLVDKDYAASLRAGIAAERATPSADLPPATDPREGRQTTHYSVVDQDGTAVAVTYTVNGWFGSHRVAGDTGILMNNEMDDFTAKPGVANMFGLFQGDANAIAPGKTPLSSMSPTIVVKDGHLTLVTGSPGGSRIITITLETIVNMIDHGMNVQEAVDAPRLHHQFLPDVVDLEPGALAPEVRQQLEAQGYAFRDKPAWGHAESIAIGESKDGGPRLRYGANDPRAPSGAARGY